MNFPRGIALLLLRILSANTGDVGDIVSEENNEDSARGNVRVPQPSKGTERRFMDDVDDRDWHVSHLKDADFDFGTECKEETFSDRAKKYRKTLKEDGSLVDYVLADGLPVKEVDLVKDKLKEKCVEAAANKTVNKRKKVRKEKQTPVNDINGTAVIIGKEVNSATVAYSKDTLKEKAKAQNATEEKSRRASEYQFSSAEYYDEVDEFPDKFCPEFVEVVHLEIDTLRNYDVECELTLEWRSLE